MEENKKPAPEVEDQERVEIDKDTLYCLTQHFTSLRTQHTEGRQADFGEPCETCKVHDRCLCNWDRIIPLMEDGQFKMVLPERSSQQDNPL